MSGHYPMMPQATQRVAVTAASTPATLNPLLSQIEITNLGPNVAFFRMGVGVQTAVLTDNAIPVGATRRYTKTPGATGFAAICAATQTADLVLVEGGGL